MPDTPSVVIVKRFTYRGANEEFSNKYHFSGTTPADAAAWKTLFDAIIAAEKLTVRAAVAFVRAYGYAAGADTATAVVDYTSGGLTLVTGTYAGTGGYPVPGDIAATIRWSTPNFNSRGKRVYLRKYMHTIEHDSSVGPDTIAPAHKTVLATFAAKLIDGTLPGTFKYCGPQGAVASSPVVADWLTTRTLKRRGKRPPISA